MGLRNLKGPSKEYQKKIDDLVSSATNIILGKEDVIKQALCCILAGGHLLIEDSPGQGKTTLVKTLAKLIGLDFKRMQFTNDMLPSDIIGFSSLNQNKNEFDFHRGPIFSQLILADEINRASPRSQSACLEAMEEGQVSVDGHTYPLPSPFVLIATQNPCEQAGSFPLPQSQLDRFLMCIKIGFPDKEVEKKILLGQSQNIISSDLDAVLTGDDILNIQKEVTEVHISEVLLTNILDIIEQSRRSGVGLSVRGSLRFLQAAKAWAYISHRDYLIPDDILAVAHAVMRHRLNDPQKQIVEDEQIDQYLNISW